ncbi:MAG: hypothetical protein JWM95_1637 [Gemmatimonadetes bacterium]|nr:hypothetical protein [Gemmatimonadota bacterium]
MDVRDSSQVFAISQQPMNRASVRKDAQLGALTTLTLYCGLGMQLCLLQACSGTGEHLPRQKTLVDTQTTTKALARRVGKTCTWGTDLVGQRLQNMNWTIRGPGEFLISVRVDGPIRDSIPKDGVMTLSSPHDAYSRFTPSPNLPQHVINVLLVGWTDVDIASIPGVALAHPASSSDPKRPGVQMIDPAILTLGNSIGPAAIAFDAGVTFEIVDTTADGFVGHWHGDGLQKQQPYGVFCMRRTK